jgi:hypothetical protein
MKKLLSLSAMFFIAMAVAVAQPGNEPPGGPDPNGPDPLNPSAVPVDGGISLLLAAGATFGARKLKALGVNNAK